MAASSRPPWCPSLARWSAASVAAFVGQGREPESGRRRSRFQVSEPAVHGDHARDVTHHAFDHGAVALVVDGPLEGHPAAPLGPMGLTGGDQRP